MGDNRHFGDLYSGDCERGKKLLWNGSETALEKVRKKVVSLEAQTRTNEAKITVIKIILLIS